MTNWVIDFIRSGGYGAIVALMLLENVFPPIPSELIMPLGGYLVSQDQLNLIGVIAAGTLGTVLGALPLYWLGYKLGAERLEEWCQRYGRWFVISPSDIRKSQRWFDKHGYATVFFFRLVPGMRSLISIPAGISRMSLLPFLLFTTIGSAIWTAMLTYVGRWLGSNYEQTGDYLGPVSTGVVVVLVLFYIWRLIFPKSEK